MTKQMKKGICLKEAGEAPIKSGEGIIAYISSIAVFLSFSCILLELSGFAGICAFVGVFLPGFVLCLLYAISLRYQRSVFFYFTAIIMLLISVILFRTQMMNGVFLFWNTFADTYTAGTGKVLQSFYVELTEREYDASIFSLSVLISFAAALLGCFLSRYASGGLAIALPSILFAGEVAIHKEISGTGTALVLGTAAFLALCIFRKHKKSSAPVLLSAAIYGCAVCILVLVFASPSVERWSSDVSGKMHDILHTQKYETGNTTLPEGDFSDYSRMQKNNATVLKVRMTEPQAMYLRGFAGSSFENNSWSAQATKVLEENKELLYWLNLNEFHPAAQFEAALDDQRHKSNIVSVENVGACSRYMYVPFSLQEGVYLQAEDLRTDSIAAEDGQRSYTYSSVSNSEELIEGLIEQLQAQSDETYQYRRAETAYREYVQENYVQISASAYAMLQKHWDKIIAENGYAKDLTLQQAKECTVEFLERCFPENGTAPFELPLKSAAGTSYQYATVAALTLRYYGIPSRYAEGYVISDEMVAKAGGAAFELDNSCAGAWAEAYLEGVGWLPIALIPGLNSAQGLQENEQTRPENPNPDSQEMLEDETLIEHSKPNESPNTSVLVRKISLLLVLILLFIVVFIIVRRKLILERKMKQFGGGDLHRAIAYVFRDAVLMLKYMGFDRRKGSVKELSLPIEAAIGREYAKELESMIELNGEAMFSSHNMESSQLEEMKEFHSITLKYLKERTGLRKKLVLKWIYCLY